MLKIDVSEKAKQRLLSVGLVLSVVVVMMFVLSNNAVAGTDSTFDSWVDQLIAYMEGSLGKGVAIAFVIVGIIKGITSGQLMAIVVGVGAALGLNYAPAIIGGMFTAIL